MATLSSSAHLLQKHHGAREVFLTQQSDANCAVSLLRKCRVCCPDDYEDCNQGTQDVEANNIYLCEYEYDTVWQVIILAWKLDILQYSLCSRTAQHNSRRQRPGIVVEHVTSHNVHCRS